SVSTEQLMSKAVRFDDYGGIEVLEVRDVARPEPGPDEVLVAVRAAGINPSEAKMRAGLVRELFPATFPRGEGSDLAGAAGAGGGVGVFAVQLAVRTGARVIAPASERHHAWLRERGAVPVAYGDGVSERITAAAEETPWPRSSTSSGAATSSWRSSSASPRTGSNTIVDFPSIEKHGVKGDGGAAAASAATLAELAEAIAAGDLVVPIQRTYPLDDVRAAFTELEAGHIAGKIVLIPRLGCLGLTTAESPGSGDDTSLACWPRSGFESSTRGEQHPCPISATVAPIVLT